MTKKEKKKYAKRYYKNHRKKMLKRVRDWVRNNRKKIRRYKRAYARKNKNKIKKYKQKNRVKFQKQAKRWWKRHYKNPKIKNLHRKRTRKWAKNHPIKRKRNRKKYMLSPRGRYAQLKYAARKRGISFRLSLRQFSKFIQLPCFYCGILPWKNLRDGWLDRINNDKGYCKENVVPCCGTCNQMRMNLSVRDFKKQITCIARNLKLI